MRKAVFAITLCASIIIKAGTGPAAFAEPGSSSTAAGSSHHEWQHDVTVLTIAPDGTWGVGIDAVTSRAIGLAIADCKRKYAREIGCGHRMTTIRAGWSLALRCGDENIIVAGRELADAEQSARRQEHDLRTRYVPNMPACVRTVTVNPLGHVIPTVGEFGRQSDR